MRVILELKDQEKSHLPIEAESIVPANFLGHLAELSVYRGNRELALDQIFRITVEGDASCADEVEVVLRGACSRIKRIGEYMDGGRIVVEGSIGMHCGNFMSGGEIIIEGDADAWLGREMVGGSIICRGDAGDYCGAGYRGEKRGMRGGRLEVFGNAGDLAAETLSGGTVIIHGNAGDLSGAEMKEGTLVIMGDCTRACANMSGGTAYVHGRVMDMIPTFRSEGKVRMEGVEFTRFSGDIANRGKGTLFIRDYLYME